MTHTLGLEEVDRLNELLTASQAICGLLASAAASGDCALPDVEGAASFVYWQLSECIGIVGHDRDAVTRARFEV